jgi:hypothetical protein
MLTISKDCPGIILWINYTASSPPFELDCFGRMHSALVTGICCALAIEYFQQFPQDAARIRLSVIVVVATTIFGLLLAMDVSKSESFRQEMISWK